MQKLAQVAPVQLGVDNLCIELKHFLGHNINNEHF